VKSLAFSILFSMFANPFPRTCHLFFIRFSGRLSTSLASLISLNFFRPLWSLGFTLDGFFRANFFDMAFLMSLWLAPFVQTQYL